MVSPVGVDQSQVAQREQLARPPFQRALVGGHSPIDFPRNFITLSQQGEGLSQVAAVGPLHVPLQQPHSGFQLFGAFDQFSRSRIQKCRPHEKQVLGLGQ